MIPRRPTMTREEFALLNESLTENFGLHFPEHKREILESRLNARVSALRLSSFMDYYLLLQYAGNGELRRLAEVVTNNETFFFRETHQFDAFFDGALDGVKASHPSPGPLRMLCAGCSSGEEPYTLNIYCKENQYRMWGYSVAIDAFDLDESRVEAAQNAEYGPGSFRGVSEDRIQRYFASVGEGAKTRSLKPAFRSGVSFAVGNIVRFETYGRPEYYDAVFCRNVLIYFSEPTLREAVENFARCLRPGGLLFLGHSESIIGMTPLFEPVRLGNCIAYRRT